METICDCNTNTRCRWCCRVPSIDNDNSEIMPPSKIYAGVFQYLFQGQRGGILFLLEKVRSFYVVQGKPHTFLNLIFCFICITKKFKTLSRVGESAQ